MTLSYYAVAFIDLLGQSEELRKIKGLPQTDDERREAEIAMGRTGRLIRQMRDRFTDLVERARNPALNDVPPERREEFKKFKTPPLFQTGFSDSFVLAMQLPEDIKEPVDLAQTANGIFLMLSGLAGISLVSLSSGVALRGGVDISLGMDVFPNEVYGPALLNAYRLESQVAQYPRILLSRRLLGFLIWLSNLQSEQPMIQLAGSMARACRPLVREDYDGYWMLHPLSSMIREAIKPDDFDNRWGHARAWIGDEIKRFSDVGDDKHRSRYIQLARYFDAHRPPDDEIDQQPPEPEPESEG
jgi:hypothetical protein